MTINETLHNKLNSVGLGYQDINPLTGNKLYSDKWGNVIEILTDITEQEE